eukprot:1507472-Lingulodinium_polyedra.AAC.1
MCGSWLQNRADGNPRASSARHCGTVRVSNRSELAGESQQIADVHVCIRAWMYLYSVYRYNVRGAKSNRNRNAHRAHPSQQNRKRGIAAICV